MVSPTFKRLLTLVGAPLIWIVHFVACYVIVSLVCASQPGQARFMGLPAALLGIAAITLIAGALIVWLAVASWRRLRRPPGAEPDISRFLAISTLLLCAISLLSMLWVAFPISMLPPCIS
jgi:hypothetical protein